MPTHPLIAVFKPVLSSDDDILERDAVNYLRVIRQSTLDAATQETLLNIFVDWLGQRFRDKSKQDIEAMLLGDLPDLKDTRSGQDLIEIGHMEGRVDTLRAVSIQLAEKQFGSLSTEVIDQINAIDDIEYLEQLPLKLLNAESIDELLS